MGKAVIGFQALLFSAKTPEELDREMKGIKDLGIDTVIVRVFHNRGDRFYPFADPKNDAGVYFATDDAPVVDDVLPLMIASARKNKLSIFAWMTTKYAAYNGDDTSHYGLFTYDFEKKKILPSFGVDFFSDSEVNRLIHMYEDLASYDIDGILFQDDFVLKHNEGMGPNAERLYGKKIKPSEFYIDPYLNGAGTKYYVLEYTDEFWTWSAFKARRLGAVAKKIIAAVKSKNPDLVCAINLSYESALRPDLALAWLSQDIGEFKKAGADYFFIMAYHRQLMREKSLKSVKETAPYVEEIAKNALFMVDDPWRVGIKLQVSDWDTGLPLPPRELATVGGYIPNLTKISLIFVPYRSDAPLEDVSAVIKIARRGKNK